MKLHALLAALGFSVVLARPAAAEECRVLTRANVAACAVAASPTVRAEREGVAAAAGRRTAADPWVPSSPTLSLTAAHRSASAGDAVNYYASLAQELEVAGQRASRRRAADAEVAARTHDVVATSRRVAASAYLAYFDLLAAREATAIAKRLEAAGGDVARVTKARADAGVASNLDAEVSDAAALRLAQARIEAERAERVAEASLALLVGRDAITVEGTLEPLAAAEAVATRDRPEIRALREDQRAHASRAEAFRRARFPTFTVQIFAENDGFNERVFGAGLALPLPLPQPLGRTWEGEAAESDALARRANAQVDQVTREIGAALAEARAAYDAARAQAALYTDERASRSEKLLTDVAKEIEAGRLGVRDAVLAQQELVGVLRGRIEAKRALGAASVALALAGGVPLEGAPR